MRVCALLEMVGESEHKSRQRGQHDRGVAGADSTESIWGSMWRARDSGGAGGKNRGVGVGLSSWRWVGVMIPRKDFTREFWGYRCVYKKQCTMLIKQSGHRVRPIWAPMRSLWLHSHLMVQMLLSHSGLCLNM